MSRLSSWSSAGTGDRQALVARATELRAAFVARQQAPPIVRPPTDAAFIANEHYWYARERFAQARGALPGQDRLARRLSDQWLEVADRVFGAGHLGLQTTEDVAWGFMCQLATDRCPASAPGAVQRLARAVPPGGWLLGWKDNARSLVEIVRFTWTIPTPQRRVTARRRHS